MQSFSEAVAAQLRAERAIAQLTIDELASASGLVRGTLLRYLNGKRDIPVPALYQIGMALGVEPHDIVERATARQKKDAETSARVTPIGRNVGRKREAIDLNTVDLSVEDLAASHDDSAVDPDRGTH
ncbi:helix-turn-helix domain-containing protein [Plantibacter sp. YIM 135249]|uniref:helix-turn-helix domain-containing protein n=1 Tax=Plantibacter sp. YIM 135249 TaxID=3423918 RepID=UPI003D334019